MALTPITLPAGPVTLSAKYAPLLTGTTGYVIATTTAGANINANTTFETIANVDLIEADIVTLNSNVGVITGFLFA